jgi:hypothetical protein
MKLRNNKSHPVYAIYFYVTSDRNATEHRCSSSAVADRTIQRKQLSTGSL